MSKQSQRNTTPRPPSTVAETKQNHKRIWQEDQWSPKWHTDKHWFCASLYIMKTRFRIIYGHRFHAKINSNWNNTQQLYPNTKLSWNGVCWLAGWLAGSFARLWSAPKMKFISIGSDVEFISVSHSMQMYQVNHRVSSLLKQILSWWINSIDISISSTSRLAATYIFGYY